MVCATAIPQDAETPAPSTKTRRCGNLECPIQRLFIFTCQRESSNLLRSVILFIDARFVRRGEPRLRQDMSRELGLLLCYSRLSVAHEIAGIRTQSQRDRRDRKAC